MQQFPVVVAPCKKLPENTARNVNYHRDVVCFVALLAGRACSVLQSGGCVAAGGHIGSHGLGGQLGACRGSPRQPFFPIQSRRKDGVFLRVNWYVNDVFFSSEVIIMVCLCIYMKRMQKYVVIYITFRKRNGFSVCMAITIHYQLWWLMPSRWCSS